MNLFGILGQYLPVFGRIVGQMRTICFTLNTPSTNTSLMVIRNLRRFTGAARVNIRCVRGSSPISSGAKSCYFRPCSPTSRRPRRRSLGARRRDARRFAGSTERRRMRTWWRG
jgi:hypothetical protein